METLKAEGWSVFRLEDWPVERLRPYESNPRRNDHAVDRMVAVLKEFGFRIPVLARSDGEIIDGHLRYKAALAMQLKSVPVLLADDLSPAQVTAFRIMVNRSASWADWDNDLLLDELVALEAEGFDLTLTGFPFDELQALMDSPDTYVVGQEEDGGADDGAAHEDDGFAHECPRCKFRFNVGGSGENGGAENAD